MAFQKPTTSLLKTRPKPNFQIPFRGWVLKTERKSRCGWLILSILQNQFLAMEVLAEIQNSTAAKNRLLSFTNACLSLYQCWTHWFFLPTPQHPLPLFLPNKIPIFLRKHSSSGDNDPPPAQTPGIDLEGTPFTLPMIGSQVGKWPRLGQWDTQCACGGKFAGRKGKAFQENVSSLQGENPRKKLSLSSSPGRSKGKCGGYFYFLNITQLLHVLF